MKKSEELKQQAAAEENDLTALGLHTQVVREERLERFIERGLPELQEKYEVKRGLKENYIIVTDKWGVVEFYPKANKVHIHRGNKWVKPGFRWIVGNLLKN